MNSILPKKAGVMGWPVEHSLSPRLHGYWLAQHKIAGSYERLPVPPQDIRSAIKGLAEQGFVGANLTVPHKELAVPLMDRVEPLAQRIGAVNTVLVHPDGTLEGRNTDAYGFMQNLLTAGFKPQGIAVILGAGGAARAAVAALQDQGVSAIRIVNRTAARAEELARHFGGNVSVHGWDEPRALRDAALLVNATSLGLKGQPPLEIDLDPLPPNATVTDMVYAPLMTDLLMRAQQRGNPVVDGLGMLLHQARPAFAAFFGVDPCVTPELRDYVLQKP